MAAPADAATRQKADSRRAPAQVTTEGFSAGFQGRQSNFAPFTAPSLGTIDVSRFTFTAPGRPAAQRPQVVDRSFSFTPSGSERNDRKALNVGVTTRTLASNVPARGPAASVTPVGEPGVSPSGYNVDLSVGFAGIAVTGGVSRFDAGVSGGRKEAADIGLSYAARNWKTGVQASIERGSSLAASSAQTGDRYGLEATGALALSRSLSVAGTLRYRAAPPNPTPLDPNKDDRAVLVGGALAF